MNLPQKVAGGMKLPQKVAFNASVQAAGQVAGLAIGLG